MIRVAPLDPSKTPEGVRTRKRRATRVTKAPKSVQSPPASSMVAPPVAPSSKPTHVQPVTPKNAKVMRTTHDGMSSSSPATHTTPLPSDDELELGRADRVVLNILASKFPLRVSRRELAILSIYSVKSSHFQNTISKLRTAGYVEGDSDSLGATTRGLSANGQTQFFAIGRELAQAWKEQKLSKAAGAILDVILWAHPQVLTKKEIADRSGYSVGSSHFQNSLSELRSLQLIDKKAPRAAAIFVASTQEK